MALVPRLDPYKRLLSRFYEALVLLWILRPVNGPHIISRLGNYSLQDVRRRFLRNLCFICDYDKGGKTTTAIGVEDTADGHIFWVSSNEGAKDRVVEFLNGVLKLLKHSNGHPEGRRVAERTLMADCLEFARRRLHKESRILQSAARRCAETLNIHQIFETLSVWLRRFDEAGEDDILVCLTAYRVRHDDHMRLIEQLGQETEDGVISLNEMQPFRDAHHMISRLAAHVRVISQLFNDASRLQSLLKSYRVDKVPKPPPATVPDVDDHMTLKGILKRLLQAGDERYETYLSYLSHMEPQVNIERRLRDKFDLEEPGTLRPCVHAEIQMLHHFHDDQRNFIADDRYVACSKFACICCNSYFRSHPANFTLLDCHQKTYPNWGILQLPAGVKDKRWLDQRRIINAVIQDLKRMVVDQISQRHISSLNHPDSVSQFSTIMGDEQDDTDSGTDVFEDGSSGTDTAGFIEDGLAARASEVSLQDESPGEDSDTGSGVQI
ncbi:hypothetical protein GQ607_004033 [Colletotrichum asianum]|uniref:Uncharacterized protein n=1 Tax=Colletotrichum asianum TaxID=702518 RepID=A0A8H3WH25_9PEZI|nr:hypothetical protein GQ607_004033 [Colletotrichum asianum]